MRELGVTGHLGEQHDMGWFGRKDSSSVRRSDESRRAVSSRSNLDGTSDQIDVALRALASQPLPSFKTTNGSAIEPLEAVSLM